MWKYIKQFFTLISAYNNAEKQYGKKWYKSKTIWVNLIALISLFLADKLNFQINAEEQLAILTVINIILRFITKEPVKW